MKTIPLSILGIFFSVALFFVNNASAEGTTSSISSIVTASAYCAFLNQAAVTDPDHLYDTAMSTDPEAACILRVGTPGSWHYEVIAGRENFLITYLNEFDKKKYCDAMDLSRLSSPSHIMCDGVAEANQNKDPFLRSNQFSFSAVESYATTLSLTLTTGESLTPSISSWNTGDTLLLAAATIGLGFLGAHCSQEAPLKPYETDSFKKYDEEAHESYKVTRTPTPSALPLTEEVVTAKKIASNHDTPHSYHDGTRLPISIPDHSNPKYIADNDESNDLIDTRERLAASTDRANKLHSFNNPESTPNKKLDKALQLTLRPEVRTLLLKIRKNLYAKKYTNSDPSLPPLQKYIRQFDTYNLYLELEKLLPASEDSPENKIGHANYVAQNVELLHNVIEKHLYYGRKFRSNNDRVNGVFTLRPAVFQEDVDLALKNYYDYYKSAQEELKFRNEPLEGADSWMTHNPSYLLYTKQIDHQFLNEQKWNVRYEVVKNRRCTLNALQKRYNNYLNGLKCTQRLQELSEAEEPHQDKNQLIKAYEAYQKDLTTNPTLGLTTRDYLRYAWEQQGWLRFRDEYGIAPYLTTSMAATIHLIKTAIGIVTTIAIIDFSQNSY